MRTSHSEPDLLVLRRLAEDLAHNRKERTTSGHLLAAIVSHPSQAAELLLERKLGAEILLKAARATTDEEPDPLARAVQRARELASRMGTSGPSAIHLLLALIHDRKMARTALSRSAVSMCRACAPPPCSSRSAGSVRAATIPKIRNQKSAPSPPIAPRPPPATPPE